MQAGLLEQFLAELLRYQSIGVQIAALTKESGELRKRLMDAYETEYGKLGDKEVGEFLLGNELFSFSRDAAGKEINVLFRTIKKLSLPAGPLVPLPEEDDGLDIHELLRNDSQLGDNHD